MNHLKSLIGRIDGEISSFKAEIQKLQSKAEMSVFRGKLQKRERSEHASKAGVPVLVRANVIFPVSAVSW